MRGVYKEDSAGLGKRLDAVSVGDEGEGGGREDCAFQARSVNGWWLRVPSWGSLEGGLPRAEMQVSSLCSVLHWKFQRDTQGEQVCRLEPAQFGGCGCRGYWPTDSDCIHCLWKEEEKGSRQS